MLLRRSIASNARRRLLLADSNMSRKQYQHIGVRELGSSDHPRTLLRMKLLRWLTAQAGYRMPFGRLSLELLYLDWEGSCMIDITNGRSVQMIHRRLHHRSADRLLMPL